MKYITKIKRLNELMQENLQKYISHKTGRMIDNFIVTLEPDWKCTARCSFCDRWKRTDLNILSKNEIFKVIDDVKDAGGKTIALGGGEPLLRGDIFEIIEYAKSKDISLTMNTNGQLLPKFADRLLETEIDVVIVSIDSPNPSIHDRSRGVKGIFKNALEGIVKLREKNINVTIGGMISKDSLNDLKGLIDLAAENDANVRFQPIFDEPLNELFLRDKDLGLFDYSEKDIEEKIDEMIAYYEFRLGGKMSWIDKIYYKLCPLFIKNPQKFLQIRCTAAARNRYFIDPEGNVFPCESRRDINLGNVRNQSFKVIINSTKLKNFRKRILSDDRKCVCWWRCEALPMIADQFVSLLPPPPIEGILLKKWESIIKKLKV